MRLLLVEDEIDIQSFLRRSLEEAGYQVEAARMAKRPSGLPLKACLTYLSSILGCPIRMESA